MKGGRLLGCQEFFSNRIFSLFGPYANESRFYNSGAMKMLL